jgi:hypothetical protein
LTQNITNKHDETNGSLLPSISEPLARISVPNLLTSTRELTPIIIYLNTFPDCTSRDIGHQARVGRLVKFCPTQRTSWVIWDAGLTVPLGSIPIGTGHELGAAVGVVVVSVGDAGAVVLGDESFVEGVDGELVGCVGRVRA